MTALNEDEIELGITFDTLWSPVNRPKNELHAIWLCTVAARSDLPAEKRKALYELADELTGRRAA